VDIQIGVDQQTKAEAEMDKPREIEGSWDMVALGWLYGLLFGRDRPGLVWWIIAAAMLYLAAHVAVAFVRGWFPVRP